jgi:hypothetical protein
MLRRTLPTLRGGLARGNFSAAEVVAATTGMRGSHDRIIRSPCSTRPPRGL